MKNPTALLVLFFAGTMAAYCQTSDAEIDAMVNLLGVQKKEAVGHLVHVSGKDSIAFWKLYDEYQVDNKKEAADRVKLYENTAMSYKNLNPKRADSLATLYFSNRTQQENKLQAYYKKIKTATNATVAFQFYQAEVYLLTMLRAQIMQQIPTYGQLKAKSKT
jgi:hypothetical protein